MNAHNSNLAATAGTLPLFDLVDRTPNVLPDDYLPHATCVAIAGDPILQAIGCCPSSKRPPGWVKTNHGVFRYQTGVDGIILQVREGRKMWLVERFQDGDWLDPSGRQSGINIYSLCHALTYGPICAPNSQAAMRLAQYCHPSPQPPIVGYWAQVQAQEHADFVERYKQDLARMGRELPHNELWVKRDLARMGRGPSQ